MEAQRQVAENFRNALNMESAELLQQMGDNVNTMSREPALSR